MVQNTREVALINASWVIVNSGSTATECLITLEERAAPVIICVAESQPSGTSNVGHTLTALDRPIVFAGLRTTQNVYAKAVASQTRVCVS